MSIQLFAPGFRVPLAPPVHSILQQIDAWNSQYAIGTEVTVGRAPSRVHRGVTQSPAWMLNCYTAVVIVRGLDGFCDLDHIGPAV